MTGARDVTQLCFSPNLAEIVANKIGQSFYFVYSYSGIRPLECALRMFSNINIVCNESVFTIYFVFAQTNRKQNYPKLAATLVGKKEI